MIKVKDGYVAWDAADDACINNRRDRVKKHTT